MTQLKDNFQDTMEESRMVVLDARTSMGVQSSRWACRTAVPNMYGNAAIASERPYSIRAKTRRQAIQSPTNAIQNMPEERLAAGSSRFCLLPRLPRLALRVSAILAGFAMRCFAISISMPRRVTSSDSFF